MNKELVLKGKKERAEIVTVSGGKGGVGKTFFSVNFAVELSKMGYRVLIFDGDVNLSNVNILLHINEPSNFGSFINGNVPIEQVILKGVGGVDVIYAGEDINTLLNLDEDDIYKIESGIRVLEDRYDFIVIDTQAGINNFNVNLITGADRVIMIANQEITSLVDLYRVIKVISNKRTGIKYEIVINRAVNPEAASRIFEKISGAVGKFRINSSLSFLGYILEDSKRVIESIQKQVPYVILHENNPITECFRIIVNNFLRSKKQKRNVSFLSMLLGKG